MATATVNTAANRMMTAEIDPMALILHGKWYLMWVEMHNPNGPPTHDVREVLKAMPEAERKVTASKASALATFFANVNAVCQKV